MTFKKFILSSFAAILLTSCATLPQGSNPAKDESKLRNYRVMTPEEKNNADIAAAAFSSTSIRLNKNANGLTAEQSQIVAKWEAIKKKYAKVSVLNAQQSLEIGGALAPLLAAADQEYQGEQSIQSGISKTVTVKPNSLVRMAVNGYCMDPQLKAAGEGEKFHLIPAEKLISPDLLSLYRAVVAYGDNNPNSKDNVQAIVWAIRTSCDADMKYVKILNNTHFKIMNESYPNGANVFVRHVDSCHGTSNNIFQSFADEFKKTIDDTKKLVESTTNFKNEMARILSSTPDQEQPSATKEVKPEAKIQNGEYSMLSPGVYAKVVGTKQLGMNVEILNTTDKPFNYESTYWAAVPVNNFQIVQSQTPNSILGAQGNQVMTAYAKDAFKYLAEKTLDKSSSSTGIGKIFVKIKGNSIRNPIFKNLLEITPVAGNALALYETLSGKDWLTDQPLSAAERSLALLSTVPGANLVNKALRGTLKTSGYVMKTIHELERTGAIRDAASWAISDTVDGFLGSYSPKTYVNKFTDNVSKTLSQVADNSVNAMGGIK
ncbi:MAG: pre-toxin TG domain-containing protein [Methylococcales bacterium]|nr:pre-toxin TG domain-containing protein [Methylococcales bacterium]